MDGSLEERALVGASHACSREKETEAGQASLRAKGAWARMRMQNRGLEELAHERKGSRVRRTISWVSGERKLASRLGLLVCWAWSARLKLG